MIIMDPAYESGSREVEVVSDSEIIDSHLRDDARG